MGFGCIPVILSENLNIPGDQNLWDQAVLRIAETRDAVMMLPSLLKEISEDCDRLMSMQSAGRKLWNLYGLDNGPTTILSELYEQDFIQKLIRR